MTGPLTFSIVTPSLNQESYIAETIESVLSQEGDFAIEYFVVDGGSTDRSLDIIRRYASEVAEGRRPPKCRGLRMQWFSGPDGGQSDAINRGLRRSTGDISAYLNSDDAYSPGAFAQVAGAFRDCPHADFVYGDGDVISEDGAVQWEWLSRPYNQAVMTSYHFLWNDFTNYIMQQATFWRSSVHAKIGLFDESFHFAMDVEYWVRAGHAGLRLQHLPKKLAKFRLIDGTKSRSSPVAFWSDYLEIYRRYRVSLLPLSFGFYCFNLAKHLEFDLGRTRQEQRKLLHRWDSLDPAERARMHRDAQRGYALGCYLVAHELQKQCRFTEAASAIQRAQAEEASAARHPLALYCRLKQRLGPGVATRLDGLLDRFTNTYRRVRVDYRYHQEKPGPQGPSA